MKKLDYKIKKLGIMAPYWATNFWKITKKMSVCPEYLNNCFYGGSEKYLIKYAEELSKFYKVIIYTQTEGKTFEYNNILWKDYHNLENYHDFFIGWRDIDIFNKRPNAKVTSFFSRDFSVLVEPKNSKIWTNIENYRKNIDYFFASSKSHEHKIKEKLNVPNDKISVFGNGIDLSEVKKYIPAKSKENIVLLGNDFRRVAVDIVRYFKKLKLRVPDAKLFVVGENPEQKFPGIDSIKDIILFNKTHESVFVDMIRKSKVVLCPTIYESFGNIGMEAQIYGAPFVGNYINSGKEILNKNAGLFIPINYLDYDEEIAEIYSYRTSLILNNNKMHDHFANIGQNISKEKFNIKLIIKNFVNTLEYLYAENNNNR